MNDKGQNLGHRVGHLEHQMGQVLQAQGAINSQLISQKESLARIESSFSRMSESVSRSGQTDWKALASWAGVVLTIVAVLSVPMKEGIGEAKNLALSRTQDRITYTQVDKKLDKLERKLELLDERLHEHQKDGHPASVIARTEANRRLTETLITK